MIASYSTRNNKILWLKRTSRCLFINGQCYVHKMICYVRSMFHEIIHLIYSKYLTEVKSFTELVLSYSSAIQSRPFLLKIKGILHLFKGLDFKTIYIKISFNFFSFFFCLCFSPRNFPYQKGRKKFSGIQKSWLKSAMPWLAELQYFHLFHNLHYSLYKMESRDDSTKCVKC